ncbi:MAG: alpha/beta hydrolase [Dehalococcoidia bacterium]
MKRGFVQTRLGPIHYREDGAGPPLVLLHRTAESGQQFDDVLPCLARGFRAVATDTPGFGDSAAPSSPPGIDGYAKNLVEALDALGITRTHLLGHRTGASIAVEVAAQYPERVDRLVLSGCPDYTDEERQALDVPRYERSLSSDGSHLGNRWARTRANLGAGVSPAQLQRSFLMGQRAAPAPHWAYEAVYAQNIHSRLDQIAVPTLLLYGERDPFARWLPELTSHLADVRTVLIPGAHALTMYHTPEEFCRIVTEFLGAAG